MATLADFVVTWRIEASQARSAQQQMLADQNKLTNAIVDGEKREQRAIEQTAAARKRAAQNIKNINESLGRDIISQGMSRASRHYDPMMDVAFGAVPGKVSSGRSKFSAGIAAAGAPHRDAERIAKEAQAISDKAELDKIERAQRKVKALREVRLRDSQAMFTQSLRERYAPQEIAEAKYEARRQHQLKTSQQAFTASLRERYAPVMSDRLGRQNFRAMINQELTPAARPPGMLGRTGAWLGREMGLGTSDPMGIRRTMQYAANIYGIGGATAGVYMWQQANRDAAAKADEVATKYDTLSRSLEVQAGLFGSEARLSRDRIAKAAMFAGFDITQSNAAAAQLISSGFATSEATSAGRGGALVELLRGINAMPSPTGQLMQTDIAANALTGYMHSQGMNLTGGNVQKLMGGIFALYKNTNLQLIDLNELAGQASEFKGKLSVPEQFAAVSLMKDVGKTSEEATTALRNFVLRAQDTWVSPGDVEMLNVLGLKPEDVDLVGETFTDIVDRISKGYAGADPAKRSGAISHLFGERTNAGVVELMRKLSSMRERVKTFEDTTGFEEAADTMARGPAKAATRLELETEQQLKSRSEQAELMKQQGMNLARARGESPFAIAARAALFDTSIGMGHSRDWAYAGAFGTFSGESGERRLGEAKAALAEKGLDLSREALPGENANAPQGESRLQARERWEKLIKEADRVMKAEPGDWTGEHRAAKLDKAIAEANLRRLDREEAEDPELRRERLLEARRRQLLEAEALEKARKTAEMSGGFDMAPEAVPVPAGNRSGISDVKIDEMIALLRIIAEKEGVTVVRPSGRTAPGSGAASLSTSGFPISDGYPLVG